MNWHCPPNTGFEIRVLAVWGRARYLSVTEASHNIESLRMSGEFFCFFKTWRPEWGSKPRSPTFQAGRFNQGPRPTWSVANQVSHVLTIIMWLTFCWLEYRISKVSTLWVLDYHMSRLSHISYINRLGLDCQVSLILTFWWLEYHIPHALTWWLSHHLAYALTL